ncbi:hypothetical protein [Glycomyces terrestris]|uniref:Tetratricopeptide repeat protein n=1 Tax=Glycomyces terrestris TaxID=2493553 RepID=A0A426UVG4_9ACTN|nr:hypothetical protein [Glycomyces terrestris]RRR98178.1 hypothetical protein EIW28_14770 [Glycomyces terrestris]
MTETTMDAVAAALAAGPEARRRLLAIWNAAGPDGDPLVRCTLAHHLADLHPDPADALTWNRRALDAADALTDDHLDAHHPGLRAAGLYPSLHLNLAEDHRRLGAFTAAARHIEAARAHAPALADDPYGRLVRDAIERTAAAIDRGDSAPAGRAR